MADIFLNISLIIGIAFLVSFLMRILKQPLIIGYIFTGIIAGPYFLNLLEKESTIGVFAKMGVALLLFTVGLHLNPKVIKEIGKSSVILGVGQVIFTSAVGFLIAKALGFSSLTSFYVSIALTFGSTIVVMKLLSDKGEISSVYGKISTGLLIIQDLIAAIILFTISSSSGVDTTASLVFSTIIKGVIILGLLLLVSIFVLPKITKFAAKSQEFLFIFSLTWAFAIASLFQFIDFSLEIGALLAGVALSVSPYSSEISSKLKPLRDFFIIIFFVIVGSQIAISDVGSNIFSIIILSLFVLIVNPLIVMSLVGILGYTKRTGFMVGITVAQISEFSIIIVALGVTVGYLSSEILSIITMVGLITIAGSSYLITYSDKIYPFFSRYLGVFERRNVKNEKKKILDSYDTILFGYNRIGFSILKSFKAVSNRYVVVDYDPEIVSNLKKFRIPVIYGDVYDSELLRELPLRKSKLIVSTIPSVEANLLLIKTVKEINPKAIVIVRAHHIDDAMNLYKEGADYVLTPHFLGGEYVANMIKGFGLSSTNYKGEKEKHIKLLDERKRLGQDGPDVEKN
ncbi:MAG: cation:proton antiporter [Nanoarchaeota archaeon]